MGTGKQEIWCSAQFAADGYTASVQESKRPKWLNQIILLFAICAHKIRQIHTHTPMHAQHTFYLFMMICILC